MVLVEVGHGRSQSSQPRHYSHLPIATNNAIEGLSGPPSYELFQSCTRTHRQDQPGRRHGTERTAQRQVEHHASYYPHR